MPDPFMPKGRTELPNNMIQLLLNVAVSDLQDQLQLTILLYFQKSFMPLASYWC